MNIYEEELEGREFDWFAIDCEGNIALFSTAGEGFIPSVVIDNYREYDNFSDLFDSPNWGSSKVWSDFARLGFYVYDWNLHGGPYNQEDVPTRVMEVELKSKLMAISGILTFPINFEKNKEIKIELIDSLSKIC